MQGFLTKFIAVTILLAGCTAMQPPALAQSQAIQQSGPVSAGHLGSWVFNGIQQDAGTSQNPNVTTLGIYQAGGTPFCISDTKVRTGVYYQLCEGISASGANIYVNSFGGAGAPPFSVIINGTAYPFPSSVPYGASPLRTVAAETTDVVGSPDQNGTIAWNSAATSSKTETLFACTAGLNGFNVTIKDERGTAGLYNVTISSSSLIDGASTYTLQFNYEAAKFQCDGTSGHWVVL